MNFPNSPRICEMQIPQMTQWKLYLSIRISVQELLMGFERKLCSRIVEEADCWSGSRGEYLIMRWEIRACDLNNF